MFGPIHPPVPDSPPAPPLRLRWREPYRLTVSRNWAEMKIEGLVSPRFWFRIYIICAVVFAALIALCIWIAPAIVLPWPQLVIGYLVSVPALFGCMALHVLGPCEIELKPDRITIFEGGQPRFTLAKDLTSLSLADAADGTLWLTINSLSRRKRKPCTRHIAVAQRVDVAHLEQLIAHYNALAQPLETSEGPARL